MWIGTRDDGLRRLRPGRSGGELDRPVANDALTSPVMLSLAAGLHGDVWAGTPDGLSHVEANGKAKRYTSSDGLPDDLVRSLLAARDGTLWVGTRHGLAHLQSGRSGRLEIETEAHGLSSDLIGILYESGDGDLWIGTLAGLSRRRDGAIRNFTSADGLRSNLVTGLAEDNARRLWVTTRDAGPFLFDGQRFAAISPLGMPQELFGVVVDTQGFLWLRGRHGIVRGSAAELAQCASRAICQAALGVYGVEDGMPSEEIVANGTPSAWRTSKGELWFATRKGVAVADSSNLPVNTVPPPVVIERFLADNYEVPLTSRAQSLPSGHTRYTFEYAGLSYTVPSKVLYRSRLEEFDLHWSDASTHRSASYTNLPPGRYTFRVQAANNDGLWNDVGAQVQFRILPPFYRRWWFLLAVSFTLIGFSILLYRLRVRRLQLRFDAVLAERNRIAREIHDTLAQDFVGVSLQLDLVSQFLARNSLPEATTQLKATRSLVNAGLEQARQSIWNLRANSTQDGLPARVTAFTQRFSPGGVVVKTKIGGAYRALPGPIEEEVLKIIQEALSNVQRHAVATVVSVQLTYEQDKLVVAVADNGRGFSTSDAAARPGHFGLQGMRERASSLGAELNLTSAPGKGTIIEFAVPILKRGSQR
jgi:signal transduction histidine kinase